MNRYLLTVAAKGMAAFCLASLTSPVFAANFVTNGSFSIIATGDTTSADYSIVTQYLNGGTYGTGLPGWTVSGLNNPPGNNVLVCLVDYAQNTSNSGLCGTALDGSMSLSTFPGPSPDGGNFLLEDALPAYGDPLQQTISGLAKNTNYTLTFYESSAEQTGFSAPGGMTQQWSVTFGSQTQNGPVMDTPNQGSTPWTKVMMTFNTGNTTSDLLSFAATGTPSGQPPMILLDGVSMQATPEPGTYAMVGIGLLTVVWGIRKRRRKLVAARAVAAL